jgi:hypothetical protein
VSEAKFRAEWVDINGVKCLDSIWHGEHCWIQANSDHDQSTDEEVHFLDMFDEEVEFVLEALNDALAKVEAQA